MVVSSCHAGCIISVHMIRVRLAFGVRFAIHRRIMWRLYACSALSLCSCRVYVFRCTSWRCCDTLCCSSLYNFGGSFSFVTLCILPLFAVHISINLKHISQLSRCSTSSDSSLLVSEQIILLSKQASSSLPQCASCSSAILCSIFTIFDTVHFFVHVLHLRVTLKDHLTYKVHSSNFETLPS